MMGQLQLTLLGLKQVILDQTEQNGHQTDPCSVYIHNLMLVLILSECSENSVGTVVILPLVCIGYL